MNITEIIDAQSGEPLKADVYVNGELQARNVSSDSVLVPVPGIIEVLKKGYHPWTIGINGRPDDVLEGPVRMNPIVGIEF